MGAGTSHRCGFSFESINRLQHSATAQSGAYYVIFHFDFKIHLNRGCCLQRINADWPSNLAFSKQNLLINQP